MILARKPPGGTHGLPLIGAVLWREGGGDQRPSSGSCEEQGWAVRGGVRVEWAPGRTEGYGTDCVSGGSDL